MENNTNTIQAIKIGAVAVGNLAGLAYAFHVKSGFWKGAGYFLLGGLALGLVGVIVTLPMAVKEANQ